MKLTGYCNQNGSERAIELENGVLLGFHAQRELWCPEAHCAIGADGSLIVSSEAGHAPMHIVGSFAVWDWNEEIWACTEALELLLNSRLPEVEVQACEAADSIVKKSMAGERALREVMITDKLGYRGCTGLVTYDNELEVYLGRTTGKDCQLAFAGNDVLETVQNFRRSVDRYLEIRASLLDMPSRSAEERLRWLDGYEQGCGLGAAGALAQIARESGCRDIPSAFCMWQHMTEDALRKTCADKMRQSGLADRLVKDAPTWKKTPQD